MDNTLVQYVRNRNNQAVGCVIATKVETGHVVITGSKCRTDKEVFNKQIGIDIAMKRAHAIVANNRAVKHAVTLDKPIQKMVARAKQYFKDVEPGDFWVSSVKPA